MSATPVNISSPLNKIPTNPQLKDVLDLWKKGILLGFNCHHLATVQTFDPGDASNAPTITATVNYKKTFYDINAQGQYVKKLVDYPIMADMPVIILGGGTSRMTFPIEQGDECLILFNDRDLDNWLESGLSSAVATNRLHSFADGIVLVGVRSNLHPIADYDMERARLQKGNAYVGVGAGANERLVKIANDQTTLNTLLQALISKLENLTSAIASITVSPGSFVAGGNPVTGSSGSPTNAGTINSIGSDLSAIAAQIGGLLE